WFGQFHRDDGGEALPDVIAGEIFVFVTQDLLFASIPVDQRCQCATEAFFVGTAFVRVDRIRVRVHRFGVCGGPLHGHFNGHTLFGIFFFKRDDVFVDEFSTLGCVQVGHVVKQTVFIQVIDAANGLLGGRCFIIFRLQLGFGLGEGFVVGFASDFVCGDGFGRLFALIGERDAQALVETSYLLEASPQCFKIIIVCLNDFCIRVERQRCSGGFAGFAQLLCGIEHATFFERDIPQVPVTANTYVYARRQRVHNRDTHTL